jgi:hypothetical protein
MRIILCRSLNVANCPICCDWRKGKENAGFMRCESIKIGSSGILVPDDEDNEDRNCCKNDCNMTGEALRGKLATVVFVHQTNQII